VKNLEGNIPSPALPGSGSKGLPRSRAELSAFAALNAQPVGSPVNMGRMSRDPKHVKWPGSRDTLRSVIWVPNLEDTT